MSFETNAGRQKGYYGKYLYDHQTQQDVFHALGREILLDRVTENIENGSITWTLSFEFEGRRKSIDVPRQFIADNKKFIDELARAGADVPPKHFHTVLDTLRLQQEDIEANCLVDRTYEHLGWIKLRDYDSNGNPVWRYCYRGQTLIGNNTTKASYSGPYMVRPTGSFPVWKQGVINEVIGHTLLEIVLLAGLSAVVNGLIAPETTRENLIIHINGLSGTGKTTGCELAVSVSSAPFQGASKERLSLLCSWGATANAVIRRCEGNRGAVIAFNEIGKFREADMSPVVYNLSEGTDKERLNTDLNAKRTEVYFTTFISTGVMSMQAKCKTKAEGLSVRVMEITDPLTDDAAHANRIKTFCRTNYGHAAPMLAQHIIDNGGLDYVLPIYNRWRQDIVDKFPDSHFRDRFVEKFPALILTTAELATMALGISFDAENILDYFVKYAEKQHRDNSRSSYIVLIEEFRKNINCFYTPQGDAPRVKAYGKVSYPNKLMGDGRTLAEEYAVRRSYVEQVLADNGFQNKQTCIKEWKRDGVLDHDDGRNTRSRRIVPNTKKSEDDMCSACIQTPQIP